MKKLLSLILFVFLNTFAQEVPPQYISYRAIALDADNNNNPITETDISLKLSILDSENSTTPIYAEVHYVQTDANGFYSLKIGDGTPITSTFDQINWASGSKFLRVDMDVNNGTYFSQYVGTSQLLSVPYAFVAGQTLNGIETLPNIQSLREYTGFTENKMVYVKGYYTEGDGGGGNFIYKPDENEPDNDGIFFKPISISENESGRWIRQYSGYLNAQYFGIVRGWTMFNDVSNSDKINNMITYASNNNWGNDDHDVTLYFPNGEYYIDKPIIIKDKVKLLGGDATLFTVKPGKNYDFMFKIDDGPVTNIKMDNFIINLNMQQNIGGFLVKSEPSNDINAGGLWNGNFKNINIINLKATGIYLEGGEATGDSLQWRLPNQFIIFENIRITRSDALSYAIKITGQNDKYTFLNCFFMTDEENDVDGGCVFISSNYENDISAGKIAPNLLSFINCGFARTRYGMNINYGKCITIDNCHFEQLDIAVNIKNSEEIIIRNSSFANAAGHGYDSGQQSFLTNPDDGQCFRIENSTVQIENNHIDVSNINLSELGKKMFILGVDNNNVISSNNNYFTNERLSATHGIMQIVNIENIPVYNNYYTQGGIYKKGINIAAKKIVFVTVPSIYNSNTNDVYRINSTITSGETIFIRANTGSIKFISMDSSSETTGKNIYLNGRTSLTLNNGQAATFIKIDNIVGYEPATYQLVSISN